MSHPRLRQLLFLTCNGIFTFAAHAQVTLSPTAGLQGQNLALVLTGQSTHWVNGKTVVSAGPGITAGTVTVNSSTLAAVPLEISIAAATGMRTITVSTGSEKVTANFSVGAGIPAITQITPNWALPGQAVTVKITGVFTKFQAGGTSVSLGLNIAVRSVTVNSETSLSVSALVAAAAPVGASGVVVQTGAQTLQVPMGFTVQLNSGVGPQGNLLPSTNSASINSHLVLQYTAPLKRSTINSTNITMSDSIGPVPINVTLGASGRVVTLLPKRLLAAGSSINVITSGVTDVFGNSSFLYGYTSTGYAIDQGSPALSLNSPTAGETGVPTNAVVSLQFSEAMDPVSVQESLTLTGPGGVSTGAIAFDNSLKNFRIQPALQPNSTYTVSFANLVKDLSGNLSPGIASLRFTTGAGPGGFFYALAIDPPTTSLLSTNAKLQFQFNAGVDATTISTSGAPYPVTAQVSADRMTVSFTPTTSLAPATPYNFTVNLCSESASCTFAGAAFTTGSGPDNDPPSVSMISPGHGQTGAPVNTREVIQLSPEAWLIDSSYQAISFTPSALLAPSTEFTGNVLYGHQQRTTGIGR